jgi:hypothetical protein
VHGFGNPRKTFAVKPMVSRFDGFIAHSKKRKKPKTLNPKILKSAKTLKNP